MLADRRCLSSQAIIRTVQGWPPRRVAPNAVVLLIAYALMLLFVGSVVGATLTGESGAIRFEISGTGLNAKETVSIKDGSQWKDALTAGISATRVRTRGSNEFQICTVTSISTLESFTGLLLDGNCGSAGNFERRVTRATDPRSIDVNVRFSPRAGIEIRSVEDRYDFAPGRRESSTSLSGPLDFVWSQNIKNEPDDVIPNWSFKSPVVMMQQGAIFAALMPTLLARQSVPLALDLDVTSGPLPWLSYGALQSQPNGHSYFRRSPDGSPRVVAGFIEYAYSMVASLQPERLGYRSVVRRLWARTGHRELLDSPDLQRNIVRPELELFDDWRQDAWLRYAGEIYSDFDCDGRRCGALANSRGISGDWKNAQPGAWFNAWFESLRTAYGWYLYGQRMGNQDIQRKAGSVLDLALTSPRNHGAFSTIYLLNDKRWVRDEGWAGFPDSYHTFCMSWTAYWMLRWAGDITPERKSEILAFARPYGDFLITKQLPSGVIPSWYDENLIARPELRDFNAETAASALFLVELATQSGASKYLHSAELAMEFIKREVLPRQRWFDFETFRSCARKNFDFHDPWTAQYPQNNLSTIQAAMAYLALYRVTNNPKFLEQGQQVLDYLLLTQQVWNNPAFAPKLVGGFTTQNTDAEWSDARQGYAAVLLWNYYQATGEIEYLERAVAAARATFAIAPWENWAHTGYLDEHGAMTGFHWGTGSAMTSVEILSPFLGDAFIDLTHRQGVGFNACSLRYLQIDGKRISFQLETLDRQKRVRIRFSGADPASVYSIVWNGHSPASVQGATLVKDGYTIEQ